MKKLKYDWSEVTPYLEANYQTMSYKEIAKNVGIPYQTLRDYARRIGLNKYKSINWTKEILDYLNAHYKDGARPIAKKFNIPITAVNKKAQDLGLKVIPKDSYICSGGYRVLGKSNERKAEHRAVMEKFLGRKLYSSEIVHHIDGDKLNNDIKNLKLVSRKEHIAIHRQDLIESKHDIV